MGGKRRRIVFLRKAKLTYEDRNRNERGRRRRTGLADKQNTGRPPALIGRLKIACADC
jgi:hypothetical protein